MKTTIQFAGRMLGWAVLALITLELCARTEDKLRYGAPFFGNYSMDSLYLYDALGKYGKPNSSYLQWHLNEAGYRGPRLREGTYRIACIGSSETFGLYESAGKEWPRQLETILNERVSGNQYEVVDVAYPGMSIGTSLLRLPQMVGAVQPKLVVIYPSYSSYIDVDKPLTWPNPPAPPRGGKPRGFQLRMATRLHNFFKQALPTGLQDRMRDYEVAHDPDARNAVAMLPEKNVEAFQTDLDHLTAELKSRGINVILVTHANRFGKQVDAKDAAFLTSWRTSYPSLKEGGFLDMERRMSEAVRRVGAKEDVPVVDGAERIAPGAANFVEFVHFTDAGAKALATIVADEVGREAAAGVISAPPR